MDQIKIAPKILSVKTMFVNAKRIKSVHLFVTTMKIVQTNMNASSIGVNVRRVKSVQRKSVIKNAHRHRSVKVMNVSVKLRMQSPLSVKYLVDQM